MTSVDSHKISCPSIFFEAENENNTTQLYSIHCKRLDVDVECYVSTAIVSMRGEWTNQTDSTLDCIFALPTPGTVMNVTLNIGSDRVITTAIVSNKDRDELLKNHAASEETVDIIPEPANPYEQYLADLFRLPIYDVKAGDTIRIQCQYLQTLEYVKKGYGLLIKLKFPVSTISENTTWDDIVKVRCKINALSPNTKDGSHIVETTRCKEEKTENEDNHYLIVSRINHPLSFFFKKKKYIYNSLSECGRDFELYYNVQSDTVAVHAIRKGHEEEEEEEEEERDENSSEKDSMCLFVTPPAKPQYTFGRALFFLLDRSGSMGGDVFVEAAKALMHGLDELRESDQFAICVFDHRQIYFRVTLVDATPENISLAKEWVMNYSPDKGTTVMDLPIQKALEVLDTSALLPFIILITDGAVKNEREICNDISQRNNLRTRIFTLGIGTYCNWFS
ncbi:hypothetical protein RFI_13831 [Reticulomyxa filosa]|uniref:VWFA domain-containing protein n=1 Tax=Reticulomyxa filosa TaxID=46433 RepID=X6NBH7_RETFI|nr:hypothetical protein RFI_13831 [Reticulomyxa filosa]|eukprot:ETO23351.1 hypothetical protein RFI_13831 [Reticulomyxa filosa]